MMTAEDYFKGNRLVDNSYIGIVLANEDMGKYGNYWLSSFKNIPMLNDIRSRSLKFTTPWLNDEHPDYIKLPKLTTTAKKLDDILDERAIELHKIATRDNKKIWIMWSGGIDSTTMLTAFIKNVPSNELKDRYSVVMSANSIAENYYFFKHYVDGKFNLINWLNLDISSELFKDTIVLHGDPANALLSVPTVAAFASLVPSGKHLLPFRENIGTLIDGLETMVAGNGKESLPGWSEWYIEKLVNAIPITDNATSIASFWWWHYVNFKWHGSMLRPFFFTRESTDQPIHEDEFKYYYDTVFYVNEDFQNWSYSNIDEIVKTPSDYKPMMRQYIHTLTNDDLYSTYKKFMASRRTNLNQAILEQTLPFVYDSNWIGHKFDNNSKSIVRELLHAFEG